MFLSLGVNDILLSGEQMSGHLTVADYIVRRLAREGITDCFGVSGDFAFKLDDAVARSEAIRWIGCSNATGESASYIEVVAGKMDLPSGLPSRTA
jgi:hypothetical protein